MSETDFATGLDSVEQAQGYTKMPLANPIPRESFHDEPAVAPDPYTPLSPREAAELLKDPANRPIHHEEPATEQPGIIEYLEQRGERAGQPMPDNQVVSPEQAAHDLAAHRQGKDQVAADAEAQSIRDAIDQLRAGDQQPAAAEPQQVKPETPVQPEAQPVEDRNQKVQRMLQDPDFLAAAQETIATQTTQAAQAKAQYESAIRDSATVVLAGIAARHPELQGQPVQNWPVIIRTLQQSAPQRASQIFSELEATQTVLTEAAKVQEGQQKEQEARVHQYATQMQERFNRAAADADASFDAFRKEQGISDARAREIRSEALAMLRDYGLSDEQIAREYNSNWAWRSPIGQRVLMEAALYRMSKRALTKAAAKPIPPVQRPGSGPDQFADARDWSTRELSARLSHTGDIKDAQRLLLARRSQKR
jgi:hypothetical protein